MLGSSKQESDTTTRIVSSKALTLKTPYSANQSSNVSWSVVLTTEGTSTPSTPTINSLESTKSVVLSMEGTSELSLFAFQTLKGTTYVNSSTVMKPEFQTSEVRVSDSTESFAPSTPKSSTSSSRTSSATSTFRQITSITSELSTMLSYSPGATTSVAISATVTPSTFLSRSLVSATGVFYLQQQNQNH